MFKQLVKVSVLHKNNFNLVVAIVSCSVSRNSAAGRKLENSRKYLQI